MLTQYPNSRFVGLYHWSAVDRDMNIVLNWQYSPCWIGLYCITIEFGFCYYENCRYNYCIKCFWTLQNRNLNLSWFDAYRLLTHETDETVRVIENAGLVAPHGAVSDHCEWRQVTHTDATHIWKYEQLREKTCLMGFWPGPTQTRLYSHKR